MRTALVLGGAACVWDDIARAQALGDYAGVVACNDVSAKWIGPLDAVVSLHANKLRLWMVERLNGGFPMPERVWSHENVRTHTAPHLREHVNGYTPHLFEGQVHSASSGHFALKVALVDLEFDRAVLCGVPMSEDQPHFFDEKPWAPAESYRIGWRESFAHIKDRARSMSGWTRDLLGYPTADWIVGG